MIFSSLKNWIVETWKYDCSRPEWLIVKSTLFCMGTGLVFLFCGWRVIGNVFFLIGCGVLVIPFGIILGRWGFLQYLHDNSELLRRTITWAQKNITEPKHAEVDYFRAVYYIVGMDFHLLHHRYD